ncbi:MAG TPA: hypothetical protein VMW48_03485 [Vicinamibacterales bacterium]|nr:hypothetical protein [Vicinamibacterales bacterium]
MATSDEDIDRLYQGPLDAFTVARNALAKTSRRPELKKLEKPSLPAWTVNQLHWHHRPVLNRVEAAAAALVEQHRRTLTGVPAEIAPAEQTHRAALQEALAAARAVLRAGGHPDTPATLEAIRNTLQALPSPGARGRLVRSLAPSGLEALAGLVLPSRTPERSRPAAAEDTATDDTSAAARRREAVRFGAHARAEQERARAGEQARVQAKVERAERERVALRAAAAVALAAAEAALQDAEAAVTEAERTLQERQTERYAAHQAVARARRAATDE